MSESIESASNKCETAQSEEHSWVRMAFAEHIIRTLSVCAILLFITGFTIENVHLSLQGFFAPSQIRPRVIFVGFTFYLYVFLPILIAWASYHIAAFFLSGVSSSRGALRSLATAAIALSSGLLLLHAVAISLHYFFVDLPLQRWPWPMTIGFAKYYFHPWSWIHWILIYAPLVFIYWRRKRTNRSPLQQPTRTDTSSRLLAVVATCGVICSIMGYIYFVYPNVLHGVGGGQPAIITIRVLKTELDAIDPDRRARASLMDESKGEFEELTPLLLWNNSGGFLYVSVVASFRSDALSFAIHESSVRYIGYEAGGIYFRYGNPHEFVSTWGTRRAVPGSDFVIPLLQIQREIERREKEEALKKAAEENLRKTRGEDDAERDP